MVNIFQNHQVKKSILYLIITSVLITITSLCAYNFGVSKVHEQLLNEEATIIGALNRIDSEAMKKVVSVVTKGNTSDELISEGKKILEGYGYSKDTMYKNTDLVGGGLNIIILSILIMILIMGIKEFLSYREFYGGVNKLNKSLERIIEGDYSVRVDDGKEGQFYVLT
ncbi:MAG: hypothetical protein ACRC2K_00110, partial [Clostridium sp.]